MSRSYRRDRRLALLLMAPAVFYLLALVLWPLINTVILSFTNASLRQSYQWIGWQNYRTLFNDDFFSVLLRTLLWTLFAVAMKLLFGLTGALLLNASLAGKKLFRILIIPPWVIPVAISMFIWSWLYNGQFGAISGLLQRSGLLDGPFEFLAFPNSAFFASAIADIWVGIPMVALFLLAALQGISGDLYEAAWVDGAGRGYRLRRITLPLVWPAVASMGVLSALFTLNAFDAIWILTRGGPLDATNTLIIDAYRTGIGNFRFGQGAAKSVMIAVVTLLFAFGYFALLRTRQPGEVRP